MGNVSAKMNDTFARNQEFMVENQLLTLERQIHMHNEMREKMVALQIAKQREFCFWLGGFTLITAVLCSAGYYKRRKPAIFVPLWPLITVFSYQADMAFGSKMTRIKNEAENILSYERELVSQPYGIPSVSSIDESRQRSEETKRLNKRVWKYREL